MTQDPIRLQFSKVLYLLSKLGLRSSFVRSLYEVRKKLGLLEMKFPPCEWRSYNLASLVKLGIPYTPLEYAEYRRSQSPKFFLTPDLKPIYQKHLKALLESAPDGNLTLVNEAVKIKEGYIRYFGHRLANVGTPPDWHRNPFTGQQAPKDLHWSKIPGYSQQIGDIRTLWEASRFGFAFILVRTYWLSDSEDLPLGFWQMVESWKQANPPQLGVNWWCGQEAAFRLMAWCFALYGFIDSPYSTPERISMLASMIGAYAKRIEGNLSYARSQKNNHAISEGVGLWTVGLLFPEFKSAECWREKGRQVLEEESQRQIYADGAYVQHSLNYHRLMLHDYLWAIRLGDLNNQPLSDELKERVRQAAEFLYHLQDAETGRVPNYGANDGTLVLPLNTCDYTDFRPVLNAVHYLNYGDRLYQPGPWDEDLLWLFGPEALRVPIKLERRKSLKASIGGYYTLRGNHAWGFIRCATYRDRPSQPDMLHFDLWRQGINIACDAGTYCYNAPPPWDNSLASTAVHNTVTVDGLDQMERGIRFLWFHWTRSRMRYHARSLGGLIEYFEGEHEGYHRLSQPVTHRRGVVRIEDDIWIIVDDLLGHGRHSFRLHWLLNDLPYEAALKARHIRLDTPGGAYGLWCAALDTESEEFSVIRASEEEAPHGWSSPYYSLRLPAISVALETKGICPKRFVTVFAPVRGTDISMSGRRLDISKRGEQISVAFSAPDGSQLSIVTNIRISSDRMQESLNLMKLPT